MTKIAIFASGAGSNAEKIISFLRASGQKDVTVGLIVCNKPGAGVIKIAENAQIPVLLIEKTPFFKENAYISALKAHQIDFIVLAGFLWKIPPALIAAFPQKIINIHPALLPKFGGKGMYGHFVHEAVIAAKELQSGITIHFVDEQYDHGATIFQATCEVDATDTAESLAQKIHQLEHQHFAPTILKLLQQ
ncbi:MAG: hypothetical protein RLY16_2646 [Bacteroidota bacterium]